MTIHSSRGDNDVVSVPASASPTCNDDEEFAVFYAVWYPRLVRLIQALTLDMRFIESHDIVQDALIDARTEWGIVRDLEKPKTWLFKNAVRRLRRIQKSMRDEGNSLDQFARKLGLESEFSHQTDEWLNEHLEVVQAIRALPRRKSEVAALRYLFGFTEQEISDTLGLALGTTKSHLHYARATLRIVLDNPNAPRRMSDSVKWGSREL